MTDIRTESRSRCVCVEVADDIVARLLVGNRHIWRIVVRNHNIQCHISDPQIGMMRT